MENHGKGNKSQMLSFWIEWVKTWLASKNRQPPMRSLDWDFPDFQPTMPLTPAVQERYQAVKDAAKAPLSHSVFGLRGSEQQARQARIASQRDSYAAQLREFQRMALEDDDGPASIDEINRAIVHVAYHGYEVTWGRIAHQLRDTDP